MYTTMFIALWYCDKYFRVNGRDVTRDVGARVRRCFLFIYDEALRKVSCFRILTGARERERELREKDLPIYTHADLEMSVNFARFTECTSRIAILARTMISASKSVTIIVRAASSMKLSPGN